MESGTGKAAEVQEGSTTQVAAALNAGSAMPLDRTHLNPYGQKVFGRLVADAIVKTQVELGPDLIGVPGGPTTVQPGGPAGARPVPVPAQPAPRPSGN